MRNDDGLNENGSNGGGRRNRIRIHFVGESKLADKLEVGVKERSQG